MTHFPSAAMIHHTFIAQYDVSQNDIIQADRFATKILLERTLHKLITVVAQSKGRLKSQTEDLKTYLPKELVGLRTRTFESHSGT